MYRKSWNGVVKTEKQIKTFSARLYTDSSTDKVYKHVAFVKKNGTDVYFPTGYNYCNQNTRIVIDAMSPDLNYSLFGAYGTNYFNLTGSGGHERFRWGSTRIDAEVEYRSTRHIFDCYKGIKITDKASGSVVFNKYNTLTGTFSTNAQLILGARMNESNETGDATTVQCIYSCQVYENETTLVRDLIPAQNLNSPTEIGLFDRVNNKFYPAVKSTGTVTMDDRRLKSITKVRTGQTVNFNI